MSYVILSAYIRDFAVLFVYIELLYLLCFFCKILYFVRSMTVNHRWRTLDILRSGTTTSRSWQPHSEDDVFNLCFGLNNDLILLVCLWIIIVQSVFTISLNFRAILASWLQVVSFALILSSHDAGGNIAAFSAGPLGVLHKSKKHVVSRWLLR